MQMQFEGFLKGLWDGAGNTEFCMVAEAHQSPEEVATGETKVNQLIAGLGQFIFNGNGLT
jgi:hypothetical protein